MEHLLAPELAPFTLALAILLALLALEVVLSLAGLSTLSAEAGLDAEVGADVDAGLDGDADAGGSTGTGGVATWLGLGEAPIAIWLGSALLGFAATGMALQGVLLELARPLPAALAVAPAAAGGILAARHLSRLMARLVPRTESSAQSARQLARRTGVVTLGASARGRPAEVRVLDRHGNLHFLRAEPLRDDEVIEEGSLVLVVAVPNEDRTGVVHRLIRLEGGL